jgi:hypothetical protein
MTDTSAAIAKKLKQLLIDSSPLIEEFTAAVCPNCTDVCCKQRHGLYRERDRWYLRGLGIAVPKRDETRPLEGPCEAMGPHGCVQERWMRPFKCTWYFCEPLLASLNSCPPKKARQLSHLLQEMADLYAALERDGGIE